MSHQEDLDQLDNNLRVWFREIPIEDGEVHSGEEFFSEFLKKNEQKGQEGIKRLFDEYCQETKKAYLSAGILHCLRHMKGEEVAPFGYAVVKKGLQSDNFEIRELSVSALDNWRGEESLSILSSHVSSYEEPIGYLRDYKFNVLAELRGIKN